MRAGPAALLGLLATQPAAWAEEADAPGWAEVNAIFAAHCVMCHSANAGASKGLRLDSYAATLAGSENGAVLVSGDAGNSELVRRLRGKTTPRMPFLSRRLPDAKIALIERWIDAGLPEAAGGS